MIRRGNLVLQKLMCNSSHKVCTELKMKCGELQPLGCSPVVEEEVVQEDADFQLGQLVARAQPVPPAKGGEHASFELYVLGKINGHPQTVNGTFGQFALLVTKQDLELYIAEDFFTKHVRLYRLSSNLAFEQELQAYVPAIGVELFRFRIDFRVHVHRPEPRLHKPALGDGVACG